MDPSQLVQYGALGVLTLSSVTVSAVLWRRLTAQQDLHIAQVKELGETHARRLEAITAEHKTEMRLLMERLIEPNTTQMREYYKLHEKVIIVLDSMARKFEELRPSRRG